MKISLSMHWTLLALSILCSNDCGHVTSFQHFSISRVGPFATQLVVRASWHEMLDQWLGMKETKKDDIDEKDFMGNTSATGEILRLAARQFDIEGSKPSSRNYTTRKTELLQAHISTNGLEGDYNHYRTMALKSTKDRAVSLLTSDVMDALRSEYPMYKIENGDLGENVLVGRVSYDFFRIGQRYKIVSTINDQHSTAYDNAVVLEITEKMEPCANLCKLSYINEGSLEPRERIARCQQFVQFLDQYDGYRGWYAKVLQEGTIPKGAHVVWLHD